MTKSDNTIKRILSAAEELFSEKGFNGTSVNMIAEKAEVNKALIYYHFKDKNDIVNSLFKSIINELNQKIEQSSSGNETNVVEEIKKEIIHMARRRKILSVMLMEALKGDDKDYYFFKCALNVMKNEMEGFSEVTEDGGKMYSKEIQRALVHEFFTGFIPIITFVVFQEKWSEFFKCDSGDLMQYFLDSFNKTHLV